MSNETPQYDASSIQSLSGREHVRKRPKMYVPDPMSLKWAHYLIFGVIENLLDLSEEVTQIQIVLLDENEVSIQVNGLGLPIKFHEDRPQLDNFFKRSGLHTDTSFKSSSYMDLLSINALSKFLTLEVKRDGYLWRQTYQEGLKISEAEKIRPLESDEETGTSIKFRPDDSISPFAEFDYSTLANRFHEYALCTSSLAIIFADQRSNSQHSEAVTIQYARGIVEYVEHLNHGYQPIHQIFRLEKTVNVPYHDLYSRRESIEIKVDIAFQYAQSPHVMLLGYVNAGEITSDSDCLTNVELMLFNTIQHAINPQKEKIATTLPNKFDVLEGLTAVVSIWQEEPLLEAFYLHSPVSASTNQAIEIVFQELLQDVQENHPDEWQRIINHCLSNQKSRLERRFGTR